MKDSYQPVILIGPARSGTKILRDVIATHPALDCVGYDINYIWRLGNESLPHDELLASQATAEVRRRILHSIGRFHNGAPYMIEKTVSNCLRVPFVNAIFPNAKYIFLIRNGLDVVESVYRQWTAPADLKYIAQKVLTYPIFDAPVYALTYAQALIQKRISRMFSKIPVNAVWGPRYEGIDQDLTNKRLVEVCAIQWAQSVGKAMQSMSEMDPARYILVRYEDFVCQPVENLNRIGAFIGVDPGQYDQDDLVKDVTNSNIGKGWSGLSQLQRELVVPHIQSAMLALKYKIPLDV